MARIVRRAVVKDKDGMRVQSSEAIIMLAILAVAIFGIRYYFVVYKNSPGYALGDYFQAMKAGSVDAQYEMISKADKQEMFPSEKDYDRTPNAHGYTNRLTKWNIGEPKVKSETEVSIDVGLSVRDLDNKSLVTSSGSDVKDTYVMKKDGDGKWRVLLSKSKNELSKKVKPAALGDNIGNG